MHEYTAEVVWSRGDQTFVDNRYSRAHRWRFDGGVEVAASSSPVVVPVPLSDPSAVDPEEAFVASLSSCHMLWFLFLAGRSGFCVDAYRDVAAGTLGKNAEGKMAMLRVILRPQVRFSGAKVPSSEEVARLHHQAHEQCYIASSVRSEIVVEPVH